VFYFVAQSNQKLYANESQEIKIIKALGKTNQKRLFILIMQILMEQC